MAVTTRRKPASSEAEQLRAELAEVRAENAELRAAVKAVAALTLGIGFHRLPASAAPPRTVTDVCRVNGVHGAHAATIDALFG